MTQIRQSTARRSTSHSSWRTVLVVAVVLAGIASTARAQEPPPPPPEQEAPKITSVQRQRFWTGLSLGVGWEKVVTTSSGVSNPFPYRFLFRNPARSGWAITPMFGWFGTDVDATAISRPNVPLGELVVRPIMVGVRRTWVRDPMSYDVALAAGPSFNSFKSADGAGPLLGLGNTVSSDANVSLAWRLQGTAWHDFTEKIAVRGSIAYVWNRPEVTFTSGNISRRIESDATSVQFGFGIVYRLF